MPIYTLIEFLRYQGEVGGLSLTTPKTSSSNQGREGASFIIKVEFASLVVWSITQNMISNQIFKVEIYKAWLALAMLFWVMLKVESF